MSLELVNTLASVGTFAVISTTAVAAVVQLRHLRTSNQLQAFMTIHAIFESPEFLQHLAFVRNELPQKILDPDYRSEYYSQAGANRAKHPEFLVCDFFEELGMFTKRGLVDKAVFLDSFSVIISRQWERLLPFIAIQREIAGDAAWENFEYLAVLARRWLVRYPNGTLSKRFPRLPIPKPLEAPQK